MFDLSSFLVLFLSFNCYVLELPRLLRAICCRAFLFVRVVFTFFPTVPSVVRVARVLAPFSCGRRVLVATTATAARTTASSTASTPSRSALARTRGNPRGMPSRVQLSSRRD